MRTPLTPFPLHVSGDAIETIETDDLVVPVFEGESSTGFTAIDGAAGGEIRAVLSTGEFRARRYDVHVVATGGGGLHARRVVLIGAGPSIEYDTAVGRRLATAAALRGRERRAGRLAFVHRLPPASVGDVAAAAWVRVVAEGLTLAAYDTGGYKTASDDRPPDAVVTVVVPGLAGDALASARAAADAGRMVGHCTNLARELVNEPANLLPPRVLAERAATLAAGTSLTVEILDEQGIDALGMGLIAGVARGSHEAPRVIVLRHDPAGVPAAPVLGLVGKGITFDAGGLCVKSPEGMARMKDDMAGGAAVVAAMRAIAWLQVPLRVIGVVPAAENMPDGLALRPGDVLRSASGRTVEVVDTDAEGRLLVGDGLWHARQLGATHLVDIATLTGACMVALGRWTAGVFGRPDAWRDSVRASADRCGEPTWTLPLLADEREQLQSEVADTVNCGTRYGGAITAALFLSEFAGETPWAHIDVAGSAWAADARPYQPKGATGFGVRTLIDVAVRLAGH